MKEPHHKSKAGTIAGAEEGGAGSLSTGMPKLRATTSPAADTLPSTSPAATADASTSPSSSNACPLPKPCGLASSTGPTHQQQQQGGHKSSLSDSTRKEAAPLAQQNRQHKPAYPSLNTSCVGAPARLVADAVDSNSPAKLPKSSAAVEVSGKSSRAAAPEGSRAKEGGVKAGEWDLHQSTLVTVAAAHDAAPQQQQQQQQSLEHSGTVTVDQVSPATRDSGSTTSTPHLRASKGAFTGTPVLRMHTRSASLPPAGSDGSLSLPRYTNKNNSSSTTKGSSGFSAADEHSSSSRRGTGTSANELSTTSGNSSLVDGSRRGSHISTAAAVPPLEGSGGADVPEVGEKAADVTAVPPKSAASRAATSKQQPPQAATPAATSEGAVKAAAGAAADKKALKEGGKEKNVFPPRSAQSLACTSPTSDSLMTHESATFTDEVASQTTTTTSVLKKAKKKKARKKKAAAAAAPATVDAASAAPDSPAEDVDGCVAPPAGDASAPMTTQSTLCSAGGAASNSDKNSNATGVFAADRAASPTTTTTAVASPPAPPPAPPPASAPQSSGPSRGDAAARQANAAAAAATNVNTSSSNNMQRSDSRANGGSSGSGYAGYSGYSGVNSSYEEGGGRGAVAGARMGTPSMNTGIYRGDGEHNMQQPLPPPLPSSNNGNNSTSYNGSGGLGYGQQPHMMMMMSNTNNNHNSSGNAGGSYGCYGNPSSGGVSPSHPSQHRMLPARPYQQQLLQQLPQQMPYPTQGMMMNHDGGYSSGAGSNAMRYTPAPRRGGGGYQQTQPTQPPPPPPQQQQQQQSLPLHRRTMSAQLYYGGNSSNSSNNNGTVMPMQVGGGHPPPHSYHHNSNDGGPGTTSGYYSSGGRGSSAAYASVLQQQPPPQQQQGMPYTQTLSSTPSAQLYYSPASGQSLPSGSTMQSSSNAGLTRGNSLPNHANSGRYYHLPSAEYQGSEPTSSNTNTGTRIGAFTSGVLSEDGPARPLCQRRASAAVKEVMLASHVSPFTPEVSPRLCRLIEQEVLTYLTPSLPCLQRRRAQLRTLAEYITAALRHAGRQTKHDYGDISFYIFGSVNMRTVLPDGDNDVTVEVDGLLSLEASRSPPPPPTPEEAAAQRAAAAAKPALPPVTTDSSAGDVDGTMQLTTAADGRPRLAAPAVLSIASGEVLSRVRDYLRTVKTPIFVDSLVMAEVRVLKLVMEGCNYDITIGQFGGVNCVRFLHEMDAAIGGEHLLKRTLLLLKAWSCYEAHVLGGQAGYIGSYAATVMLISMLNTVEFLEDGEEGSINSSSSSSSGSGGDVSNSRRRSTTKQMDPSSGLPLRATDATAAATQGSDVAGDSRSPDRAENQLPMSGTSSPLHSNASSAGVVVDDDAGSKKDKTTESAVCGKGNADDGDDGGEGGERREEGEAPTCASANPIHASSATSLHPLSPLTLLARFLKFYAYFDFDHYCVTAFGPLPLQKISAAPLDLSYLEVDAAHSRPLEGEAAANRAATDLNFLGLTAEGEATIGHFLRRRRKPLLTVSGVKHLLDEVNQSRRAERQARHQARRTAPPSAATAGKSGVEQPGADQMHRHHGRLSHTPVQLDRAGCTSEDAGLMCPSCTTAVFPVRDMNVLDPLRWSSNMVRGVCRNHLQRIRCAFLEGVRLLDVASRQLDGDGREGSGMASVMPNTVATTTAAAAPTTAGGAPMTGGGASFVAGVGSPASHRSTLSGASSCRSWTDNCTGGGVPPVLGTPASEDDATAGGSAADGALLYPGYPAPHSQCTRREVAVLQLLFPRSIDAIRKNSALNCPWNREDAAAMAREGVPQCPTCASPSLLCTPDIHRMCEPQLIFHATTTHAAAAIHNDVESHDRASASVLPPVSATSPTVSADTKARATQQQQQQHLPPQQQANAAGRGVNAMEPTPSELEDAIAGEDTSEEARSGGPLGEAMVPPARVPPASTHDTNGNMLLYPGTQGGSNNSNVAGNCNSGGGAGGGLYSSALDSMQSSPPQQLMNVNSGGSGGGGVAAPSMMASHGVYSPGPVAGTCGIVGGAYGPAANNNMTATMLMGAEEDYYGAQANMAVGGGGGNGVGFHGAQSPLRQRQQQQLYQGYSHHPHQLNNANGLMPSSMMMFNNGGGGGQLLHHHYSGGNIGAMPSASQPYVRIGSMQSSPGPGGYHSPDSSATSPQHHHVYSSGNHPGIGLMGRTCGGNNTHLTSSPVPMPMPMSHNNNNSNIGNNSRAGAGGYGGGWVPNPSSRSQQQQQQQTQYAYAPSMSQQQQPPLQLQQLPQRGAYVEGSGSQMGARMLQATGTRLKIPTKEVTKGGSDAATLAQNA